MTVRFKSNGIRYALVVAYGGRAEDERRVAKILRPDRSKVYVDPYDRERCVVPQHIHRPKRRLRGRKAHAALRNRDDQVL